MASESIKLPFINFSIPDLKLGTPEWNSLKVQVRRAMEEFGCFEASFDKIPVEVRKDIFDASKELFDLPEETKLRCSSDKTSISYLGRNHSALSPIYESMGIADANVSDKVQNFTQILWPQGNPHFSNAVLSYTRQLSDLDQMIRRMLSESLGLAKYFDEHLESTEYVVFLNKYKAPESDEAHLGLKSHKDQNTLTILSQNQVDGLQVQTKDGQWFDVKPAPDSFVVILGEAFAAWINGRLEPPAHRVMLSGTQTRHTIGLYASPRPGYKVTAPEELVNEEHPLLFKPYDQAEYDEYLFARIASDDLELKTFCGTDRLDHKRS